MKKLHLSCIVSTIVIYSMLLNGCGTAYPPTATAQAVAQVLETRVQVPTPVSPTQTVEKPTVTLTDTLQPSTEQPAASPTPDTRLLPDRWMEWPVVPVVSENAKKIYQKGLEMGTNPRAFSKVGDCQNVRDFFLGPLDDPRQYRLGKRYEYLKPTIDYYAGVWSRTSLAVKGGFNVASVLSPMMADPKACQPNETPLLCELRLNNPSIVIISMETWWAKRPADLYGSYLRQILDIVIQHGAVPILGTKADNLEGDNSINSMIAQIAYDYDIPLWNFWAAAHALPDGGLQPDGFHLTVGFNYYDDKLALRLGWPVRNLTALQAIDAVRLAVAG